MVLKKLIKQYFAVFEAHCCHDFGQNSLERNSKRSGKHRTQKGFFSNFLAFLENLDFTSSSVVVKRSSMR